MIRIGVRRLGAWGLLPGLLALAAPVFAQSLLSQRPPAGNLANMSYLPFEPELALLPGQALPSPLPEALYRMVDAGQGEQAYPLLRVLLGKLQRQAAAGEDAAGRYRKHLAYLLRAGDRIVPPEEQERLARQFVEKYPDDPNFPWAFFYLTQSLFRQGKPLEESFFFDDAALDALPELIRARYFRMQAESATNQHNLAKAAEYLLRERERLPERLAPKQVEIQELLEQLDNVAALQAFVDRHKDQSWLVAQLPLLRIRVLVNQGQYGQTLLEIQHLQRSREAASPAAVKYLRTVRQEIEDIVATVPRRIGVLLPLGSPSGGLRALAGETLDGLRMAVQFPPGPPTPAEQLARLMLADRGGPGLHASGAAGPGYELVIRDTQNDPDVVRRQVRELVHDEHVIAIIGPVARIESTAAAEEAAAQHVPLISLSLSLDIAANNAYAFRHSKNEEEEVAHLVAYATDYLHAERFVLLYPNNRYGERMARLFWDDAVARGGRIIASRPYDMSHEEQGQSELKDIFEDITGMNRPVNPADAALLEAAGDKQPDPIVDFDALYIPIGPNGASDLRVIASYPVTVDAERVMILGNRFWNSDSILVAAEGKIKAGLFVDSYDRSGKDPQSVAFRHRHFMMFGHRINYRKPTYYTAVAYDTIDILKALVEGGKLRSREALARALVNMKPYAGVTGLTSFLENGEAVKESMFFRMEGTTQRRVFP